ncbi:MAG: hypothetical protein PHP56_12615 [Smithellaceae bacterium]|jgi:hypothetical protein|nr:hypothetical protein [Smithellaceae bacterium]
MSSANANASTGNDLIVRPRKLSYGIRKVKTLDVWPLSIGDQGVLIQRIDEDMRKFFGRETGADGDSVVSNADFAMFGVKLLRENLKEIVRLVTGKEESEVDSILSDMTNKQADALIQIVWEENYADIIKNRKGLLGMIIGNVASAMS